MHKGVKIILLQIILQTLCQNFPQKNIKKLKKVLTQKNKNAIINKYLVTDKIIKKQQENQ